MQILPLTKNDIDDFLEMWERSFGDGPDVYHAMKRCFGYEMNSYILTDDDGPKSALSQIDMGKLIDESGRPVSDVVVSYAINTLDDARGSGYGSTITDFAKLMSLDLGSIPMLCPATPSLVDFYRRLDYLPYCYVLERHASGSINPSADFTYKKIDPASYNELREEFLLGRTHVALSDGALSYVDESTSGLYKLAIDIEDENLTLHITGIASSNGPDEEGNLFLDEVLLSPVSPLGSHIYTDPSDELGAEALTDLLASCLADELGANSCAFRMPVPKLDDNIRIEDVPDTYVQAMRAFAEKENGEEHVLLPYFGFPFD